MLPGPLFIAALALCLTRAGFSAPLTSRLEPETYIVKLKQDVNARSFLKTAAAGFSSNNRRFFFDPSVFNGYATELTLDNAHSLQEEYSNEIEYIERDSLLYVQTQQVQTDAPWGLQRISQKADLRGGSNPGNLDYAYKFDDTAGEGVDIYILDSGVYQEHDDLLGRVARSPVFALGAQPGDRFGHGTPVAATAAGTRYGVAKRANIIDVKVAMDSGSAYVTNIIQGLSWSVQNVKASNRSAVINMSLGGGASPALDDATRNTIASGVPVVVSAGNAGRLASLESPAGIKEAITVASLDINGVMAANSNWGPAVDVFAPGVNVISADIQSPNASKVNSGTSMAAPHVAGVAAYILALEGPRSPVDLTSRLLNLTAPVVSGGLRPNTTNLLIQNGIESGVPPTVLRN